MTDTLEATAAQASPVPRDRRTAVAWLFGMTGFTGAGLLFMVQPMVAKLVLPSYGGSATVWSTSSLFFQVLLLLGYAYTHVSTGRLSSRTQPRLHLLVLLVPILTLPVALPGSAAPAPDASPALWLLRTLVLMIGLPFFLLSTTGPLLQRWYSWTDGVRSDDPYFLFAASNFGSFGGLLAYPFLIEPHLTLDQQRFGWSIGFVAFALLMGVCGIVAGRARTDDAPAPGTAGPSAFPPPALSRVATWTLLAFLPSTLMLAVTAHLSTDVAPIPLLWVVPLAIYLATFVVAFARTSRTAPVALTRIAVVVAVTVAVTAPSSGHLPIGVQVGMNLAALTLVAYAAHARLAADRPDPAHLTHFYLVIAVGGALGGLMNGLLAPAVFDRVWEYPLALMAVPLLLVGLQSYPDNWFTRRYHPAFVAFVVAGLPLAAYQVVLSGMSAGALAQAAVTLGLAGLGWMASRHPGPLALSLVLAFSLAAVREAGDTLERTRTFYGSYAVKEQDGRHLLVHGNTVHGVQVLGAGSDQPTTYYRAAGPLGDVFRARAFQDVAIIGLGAGEIAAWGEVGQRMKFFEVDPEIVDLASDASLFTYLSDSPATLEIAVGDGRLLMSAEPEQSMDLVILDAFNSDAIPIHLLTREAMHTYARGLRSDGLLAVHISNRIFDLEPVLAAAAEDLGWTARIGDFGGSRWVVLGADPNQVKDAARGDRWREPSGRVRWTDDYSSLLDVLLR